MNRRLALLLPIGLALLGGCQQRPPEYQAFQVHQMPHTDKVGVIRATQAALQDIGFVVTLANSGTGKVQAMRMDKTFSALDITVEGAGDATVMKVLASYEYLAILNPSYFQQLFEAVDRRVVPASPVATAPEPAKQS